MVEAGAVVGEQPMLAQATNRAVSARIVTCHLTSAISGGAQSARRLLIETSGTRSQFLQAA
jgi:hypothetical protein